MTTLSKSAALQLALAKIARLERALATVTNAVASNNRKLPGFVRAAVTKLATPDMVRRVNDAAWAKRENDAANARERAYAQYVDEHEGIGGLFSAAYENYRTCDRLLSHFAQVKALHAVAADPNNAVAAKDVEAIAAVEAKIRDALADAAADLRDANSELRLESATLLIAALENPPDKFDMRDIWATWQKEKDVAYEGVAQRYNDALAVADFG